VKTAPPPPLPNFLQGIVVPPASHQILDDAVALNLEKAELIKSGLQELSVEKCWGKDIMDPGTNCTTIDLTPGDACNQFFETNTGHYGGIEYVRCEANASDATTCTTGLNFCWHVYDKDASAEAGHYVDMTMGKKDLTMVKVAPDLTINYGMMAGAVVGRDYYGASNVSGGINANDTDATGDTNYTTDAQGPYLLVTRNATGTGDITERQCKKLVGTQSGSNANLGRAIRYAAFGANGCHTYETYFKLSAEEWDTSEHISGAWFYDNPNKEVESIYATGDDPNADVTSVGSGAGRGA